MRRGPLILACPVIVATGVVAMVFARSHRAAAPAPVPSTFRAIHGPDGVLVRDDNGDWLVTSSRNGGSVRNTIVGLRDPKGSFPALPANPFDPQHLNVPLDQWTTIHVPTASQHQLLVVTIGGFDNVRQTVPTEEVDTVVREIEAKRITVRDGLRRISATDGGS